MAIKITAPALSQDISGAELLIQQHKEHKVEIDARKDVIHFFYETGAKLIQDNHFLASEIKDKIKNLERLEQFLNATWEEQRVLYEQNMDVQLFKQEASLLDNWLSAREDVLSHTNVGDNISQVKLNPNSTIIFHN